MSKKQSRVPVPPSLHDSLLPRTRTFSSPHQTKPRIGPSPERRTKFPMDPAASPERPRKRRAINACTSCRASKVRCDGQRPCQRCARTDTECRYFDAVKDVSVLRIERLETEVETLKATLNAPQTPTSAHSATGAAVLPRSDHRDASSSTLRGGIRVVPALSSATSLTPAAFMNSSELAASAVDRKVVTWNQASFWYQSFFSGSHYFVPVFCERIDTIESVSSRSAFLFDTIVSVGCRAEEGYNSSIYHRLQVRLREHLTTVLINDSVPTLEVVQAIAVMAGYSENGMVLTALALRFAFQLGLSNTVDELIAKTSKRDGQVTPEERELYRLARVWHGVCNLELFFSLDGGKLPGVMLRTSSRKIRALIKHPERTNVDVRLLSQVELNIIRSNAYSSVAHRCTTSASPDNEALLRSTVQDTTIELSLWLEEWNVIVSSETAVHERPLALLNLRIQYEWALITLHLKALADSGIENIAIMTEFQRDMVRTAKEAAVRHLHHLLEASSSPPSPNADSPSEPPRPTYLSLFKWTMDYVWAKCAFSVLLVLKLALLLRDPLPSIVSLLRDAYAILSALNQTTVGNIAYFQILQTSIEKCEGALREHMAQLDLLGANGGSGQAEDDFQGYAPSEFVFEWDFPGLNLRHVQLGWQDLFIDLDNVF